MTTRTITRTARHIPKLRSLPGLIVRGMSREIWRLLRLTFRGSGKLLDRTLHHPLTWLIPFLLIIARYSFDPGITP